MKRTEEEGLVILLVGLAVGLLAGLLWAPQLGSDTRRERRRGAQDGFDYLSEGAVKVRDGGDRLADRAKRWLAGFKASVRAVKATGQPGLEDLGRQA
jgi:gas vesicle protein